MSEPLLEVTDLVKHFPIRGGLLKRTLDHVRAVDGVTFQVRKGETVGLVGESGCGKTTVGRTVLRLADPTSGSVRFKGEEIATLPRRELRRLRPHMQIVFQDPMSSLNPRLTVRQILLEPLLLNGRSRETAIDRMVEVLEKVGLTSDHANRFPHEFSGGQRQRIGVARALVLDPDFIVLDEPTSALDVSVQAQVLNLLDTLQKEMKLTYLFISHDLSVVRHLCDRVAVMYLGKIVEEGPVEAVFRAPQHPYTQALLSAVPIPDPAKRAKRVLLPGDVPSPVNPPSGCRFHPRCPIAAEICNWDGPRLVERAAARGVGPELGDPAKWPADRSGADLPRAEGEVQSAIERLFLDERRKYGRAFWRTLPRDGATRVDFEPWLEPGATSAPTQSAACFFAGTDITTAETERAKASREKLDPTKAYERTQAALEAGKDPDTGARRR